jgi:sulfatase maturation enzyme AslB (radical SAM superfamily)
VWTQESTPFLQQWMPSASSVAANQVIITVFAASNASDAAHGCEQGDYHPLCSNECPRHRLLLRTR